MTPVPAYALSRIDATGEKTGDKFANRDPGRWYDRRPWTGGCPGALADQTVCSELILHIADGSSLQDFVYPCAQNAPPRQLQTPPPTAAVGPVVKRCDRP